MKYLILALIPFPAFAGVIGQWEGPGNCFLDTTHTCTITASVSLLEDNSLLVEHCSQDTGSPVQACFVNRFTIENENELWFTSQELGKVKVGSYAPEKIAFNLIYADQTIAESYELNSESLKYSVDYTFGGKSLLNETGLLQKKVDASLAKSINEYLAKNGLQTESGILDYLDYVVEKELLRKSFGFGYVMEFQLRNPAGKTTIGRFIVSSGDMECFGEAPKKECTFQVGEDVISSFRS